MVDTPTTPRLKLGAPRNGEIDATSRAPYGWAPLAVLFVVGLVDRIEHNLLAGVLPLLQAEWGFSDTVAGSIPTASALAAALVALPAGYIADRRSRTRIITVVVFCWALATLGSGLATSFALFYMMRVFLAAAESIDNPAAGSLLADYYPPASRAQAYGWTRITAYLGGIGTLLGGVLAEAFGDWRSAFLIMVVPGVLTALLVWRLREPERGHLDRLFAERTGAGSGPATGPAGGAEASGGLGSKPALDVAGGSGIGAGTSDLGAVGGSEDGPARPASARQPFGRQFREVITIPTLLAVSFGLMLVSLGLGGVFYWLPSLLVRNFGIGIGAAGSLSGLMTIVGVVGGTLIGSWLGRVWHGTRKGGRLLAGGGGITVGSATLAAALTMNSLALFCVVLTLSSVLMSMAIPNLTASLADVVPAASRGIGFAILQLFLTGGVAFGPLIVGIVSDGTGSLVSAMYALIVPMVVGGLITLSARGFFERDARRVLEAARR
ncbi:MFS transporter [Streptosporangium longisporum]|uniref:Major facilitator superfamily (MFS) profile domain-containing protein n=1 Tax=Streptosporangium longisporum TaxID=46187 RepID=A0ABP6KD94_9ACTN